MKLTKRDIDDTFLLDFGSGTAPIFLSGEELGELRAHFLAERDEQLCRWRDPEEPDLVVYLDDLGLARVIDEMDGHTGIWGRDELEGRRWISTMAARVAQRYFEAHPEPKPWHDAKPEEVWVLTIAGEQVPALVAKDRRFVSPAGAYISPTSDPNITSGRRLWPVAEEADQ